MKNKFSILLVEEIDKAGMDILKKAANLKIASAVSEDILVKEIKDMDAVIIRAVGKISAKIIESANKLKVIGRHGAGYDNVDVETATRHKIPVIYTPQANTESVADHTIGLLIAVAKKIPQAHHALTKKGDWFVRYTYIGTEIYGKTLGLIGLGKIGRAVAKRAKGFRMRILAHDPFIPETVAQKLGVRLVDLNTLLKNSDFVSLHVPLTKETQGLISKEEIEAMKDGAYLVNTSRGELVDENAVYEALVKGKLAGAAFDVYAKEPPDPRNPLFKLGNVVATPHMAAHTKEALRRMAVNVASDVVRVLKGSKPKYVANPEVYKI
ncbi:MAG: hydroxyacid dehydrogenase [Candidatus Bathyarchaeia archaeon]